MNNKSVKNIDEAIEQVGDVAKDLYVVKELMKVLSDKIVAIQTLVLRYEKSQQEAKGLLLYQTIRDVKPMGVLSQECIIKLENSYEQLSEQHKILIVEVNSHE
ncbi:hypothetical protein M2139_001722 [Enterococcus sp. PF1-24]|uniref:hypothetical protein n=1 Tax=unclassified Enterococcus TaxID=2608891 RepID=UPI00247371F2|nr:MULTISPECIES: hypothetical protein [unclassified Enterococcus]MDH6364702.1 hypothetical protein [Enterococcus sp. PFB1-1]MDH6401822.1 hypothetical protein [Enterococcus sp. PF1-24]